MIKKRSALLGLVAAAASAVLLADPATAQAAPSAAQVQVNAKAPSSGASFEVADRPIPLIGHRRRHRRHHRRFHRRRFHHRRFHHRRFHHRRFHHRRFHHRRYWGGGHHSNWNSNRNTNTNTNVNINSNVIDIDP